MFLQIIKFKDYEYHNTIFKTNKITDLSDIEYDEKSMKYIELIYEDLQNGKIQMNSLPKEKKVYVNVMNISQKMELDDIYNLLKEIYPFKTNDTLKGFTIINILLIMVTFISLFVIYYTCYEFIDYESFLISNIVVLIVIFDYLFLQTIMYILCILNNNILNNNPYVKYTLNLLIVNCLLYDILYILISYCTYAFMCIYIDNIAAAIFIPLILFVILTIINIIILGIMFLIGKGHIFGEIQY